MTGASSGIGRALAGQFGMAGFDVVVAKDDRITATAAELQGHGVRALPVRADLATFGGVQALHAAIAGAGTPEAVAINAGVGVDGDFARTTT